MVRIKNLMVTIKKDFLRHKGVYLLFIPVLVYYVIFCYGPMYGAQIAFRNYTPGGGITGSTWVGLKHFKDFFNSYYFSRILKNTLAISLLQLAFGFPAPIILALLINELRSKKYARLVQTVTYMPYMISLVVVCAMIRKFVASDGIIVYILSLLGIEPTNLLLHKEYFRTIFVGSNIWSNLGWGSIVYIAAIANVDASIYEAAKIDGAGRLKQIWHVTLPGIMPTIVIMLILRLGEIMNVGFEKIILLYNPTIYDTADVISSFVYRKGLIDMQFSSSAAVGLFNSVVNFILVIGANYFSRKLNETSLW